MNQSHTILTPPVISVIESVLAKGDRAEVIPVKNGVKVIRVRRETVKHENNQTGRDR